MSPGVPQRRSAVSGVQRGSIGAVNNRSAEADPTSLCRGGLARRGKHLGDAFVVEDAGCALGADEHADAAADDEGFGVIDRNPVAAHKLHDVGVERRATLNATQGSLEMLGGHARILPRAAPRRDSLRITPLIDPGEGVLESEVRDLDRVFARSS